MTKQKKRLDLLVQEQFPSYSRQQIQSLIMQGKVFVDGKQITKAGQLIACDLLITCNVEKAKYVSRAGYKLEKALEYFQLDVRNFVALDAGISTGGFTDCLLQNGAATIYGIDVGYGQVAESIRNNPRVILLEKTNLRLLKKVGELVDLITLDLSFISVLKVMEAVTSLLKPSGHLIVLIKPQFEAEKNQVGRGGIIKDAQLHEQIVQKVITGIISHNFLCVGVTESPILGATGNKEFLAYFRYTD